MYFDAFGRWIKFSVKFCSFPKIPLAIQHPATVNGRSAAVDGGVVVVGRSRWWDGGGRRWSNSGRWWFSGGWWWSGGGRWGLAVAGGGLTAISGDLVVVGDGRWWDGGDPVAVGGGPVAAEGNRWWMAIRVIWSFHMEFYSHAIGILQSHVWDKIILRGILPQNQS